VTDRETRRLSFGSVAADYDRYRPSPPPQALDWLLPPGAKAVLDLTAGTGVITLGLERRAEFSRRVRAFLDSQPWERTDVPMICRCLRSTRLPG